VAVIADDDCTAALTLAGTDGDVASAGGAAGGGAGVVAGGSEGQSGDVPRGVERLDRVTCRTSRASRPVLENEGTAVVAIWTPPRKESDSRSCRPASVDGCQLRFDPPGLSDGRGRQTGWHRGRVARVGNEPRSERGHLRNHRTARRS